MCHQCHHGVSVQCQPSVWQQCPGGCRSVSRHRYRVTAPAAESRTVSATWFSSMHSWPCFPRTGVWMAASWRHMVCWNRIVSASEELHSCSPGTCNDVTSAYICVLYKPSHYTFVCFEINLAHTYMCYIIGSDPCSYSAEIQAIICFDMINVFRIKVKKNILGGWVTFLDILIHLGTVGLIVRRWTK